MLVEPRRRPPHLFGLVRYLPGMPVDLRLMRYVIAIAEAGSFEGAAERLHMSQPPLSRQVSRLERELGVRLFHRRPTRLTEPGRVFVESARQVIAEAERAIERTRQAGRSDAGTVRVGYAVTTAFEEMPKLFTAMRERHPQVRVEAREAWDDELARALLDGELDVLLGRHLPTPPAFRTVLLRRDRYAVVVGHRHRLARRETVSLCELRGETLRFFPRDRAPCYHDAVLAAVHSTGERFDVWENPLPGLRNLHINLRERGFMVLPTSLRDKFTTGVAWLPIRDALPSIDLTLCWQPRQAPHAAGLLVGTARRLARQERWTPA